MIFSIDGSQGLQSKDVKLLDVVQSMGEYLTDDDATVRANGLSPDCILVSSRLSSSSCGILRRCPWCLGIEVPFEAAKCVSQ